MTSMDTNEASLARYESDSIACRLVVAAYTDAAGVIRSLAAEAARRIMMSPSLGDIMDVAFADVGTRSLHRAEASPVAERVADELTTFNEDAGRHFFALMIVDASAAAVEAAFADCRSSPIVAALPLRMRGLAAEDDCSHGVEREGQPSPSPEIRISPADGWTASDLVDQMRVYAEDLFQDIATTHE